MSYRRSWGGEEWQLVAHQLVQLRHGYENVQVVPDHVKGDAGIEFFSLNGVLYQCYAPEETSDVKKAAAAMKAKAARDLPKLVKNRDVIIRLLAALKANRWILLCPFLDDKEVVADIRSRGAEFRKHELPFLTVDFEALVHSQEDFAAEIKQLRMTAGLPLRVEEPATEDVLSRQVGEIGQRLSQKLQRGFGAIGTETTLKDRRDTHIKAYLFRENAMSELRLNHPALWEKAIQSLDAEEQRLVAIGATTPIPGQQLAESIQRIETSLSIQLPTLDRSLVTRIAVGTVSDWLIRCPLDFPTAHQ